MGKIALRLFPLLAGVWTSAFSSPTHAADAASCKPLQLINSIKMTTNADRSIFYVPVQINGTPKNLILDTGGGLTQILQSTANELKLEDTRSRLTSHDLYGHESDRAVRVATFDLGNQRGENMKFQLAPMPTLSDDAAGLLSTDLFLQYDIDMDFGADRLNYFSQDHCEGKVAYWSERPLAILPVNLSGGHLNIVVTLDGEIFNAVLDTGAPATATRLRDIIGPFHMLQGSPDLPVIAVAKDNPDQKVYAHKFERLSFGDITVLHPQIGLLPDTGTGATQFGQYNGPRRIIIGMNVLRQLHLYIAYREKKLYITPAGTGESVLFKSPATPP